MKLQFNSAVVKRFIKVLLGVMLAAAVHAGLQYIGIHLPELFSGSNVAVIAGLILAFEKSVPNNF